MAVASNGDSDMFVRGLGKVSQELSDKEVCPRFSLNTDLEGCVRERGRQVKYRRTDDLGIDGPLSAMQIWLIGQLVVSCSVSVVITLFSVICISDAATAVSTMLGGREAEAAPNPRQSFPK